MSCFSWKLCCHERVWSQFEFRNPCIVKEQRMKVTLWYNINYYINSISNVCDNYINKIYIFNDIRFLCNFIYEAHNSTCSNYSKTVFYLEKLSVNVNISNLFNTFYLTFLFLVSNGSYILFIWLKNMASFMALWIKALYLTLWSGMFNIGFTLDYIFVVYCSSHTL